MDCVEMAIARLKEASQMALHYYKEPLVITTSGGKDSSACVQLAIMAGIPMEVHHNHTTADAPETVYFVRQEFKRLEAAGIKCIVNMPTYKGLPVTMWSLIPQKLMPPTRMVRYCCAVLKEQGGRNRMITTGVRWAESPRRKSSRGIYETMPSNVKKKVILNNDNDDRRRLFETCNLKAKRVCNPIVDWKDSDVWGFLEAYHVPVNPLYECGFTRVGCIGCPMAGKTRKIEFAKWPTYERAYIRSFEKMLAERARRGKLTGTWNMGTTGMDVFHWWMEDGVLPGQLSFDDYEDLMETYE